jgi:hemerythrin-like domain-containing protein
MLREHELGRSYIQAADKEMVKSSGVVLSLAFLDNIDSYVMLLRSHISKEENIVFAKADEKLTSREQERLHDQFEEVEESRLGKGMHEEYIKMIDGWEHDFGLAHQYSH